MYKPLQIKQGQRVGFKTSLMPKKGMNLDDLSQLLNLDYAIEITNYIPYRFGLEKRGGLKKIFERAGSDGISLLEKFTTNVWIFGYGTKIEAYNESTEVFTTIKGDFSVNDGFDGEKYGQYFFVCNGVEKIHRMDNALAISEIAASPICNGLVALGSRLHAFNLSTDSSADQYSDIDDGTDPPFDNWNISTVATQGGRVNFRNAGTARSVLQLGQYTVVFCDDGYYSYWLNTFDSAGTLTKVEVIQDYVQDYGGGRGAISTKLGIFYANEAGVWHMQNVGSKDLPASRQQVLTSTLLGSDYFKGVDFDNADLAYDELRKILLVTCAKDSVNNNLVLCRKMDSTNAFFQIKEWNISRFAKSGNELYGASSVNNKVFKLFEGYTDDGLAIGTIYHQEIPMDSLFSKNKLKQIYTGGSLSPSSILNIAFDIYDVNGKPIKNKTTYEWTPQRDDSRYAGFGQGSFGKTPWGGDMDTTGLVESFDGGSPRISNFQRLQVKITGGDKVRHILNWIACGIQSKAAIRRRHITKLT